MSEEPTSNGYVNQDGSAFGRGGLTSRKRKRVSRVFHIWDWPRGTRKRGWGLLHDQIWFYDDLPCMRDRLVCVNAERTPDEDPIYMAPNGTLWRYDHKVRDWLRLYMDRRMLWLPRWLARLRVRIHRFHSGDDDSAPHDHPWAFVTFPLADYTETVFTVREFRDGVYWMDGHVMPIGRFERDGSEYIAEKVERVVRRFRFHRRPATYRHIVHEPERPFTTIVLACERRQRLWGFWPRPDHFVAHDVWTKYD